jgi:dTDP-L-rhamnose 4-epimerase
VASNDDIILVTGGAGFIGCRLAQMLGNSRGRIIAVDNLHPQIHPERVRPEELPEHVELVVGDVCSQEFWDCFLHYTKPKIVIHLAAETGTGQSLSESTRHAQVNVVGTTQMLDAFRRASHVPKHILLSSSRAVYGEGAWRGANGEIRYPGSRTRVQLEKAQWDFSDLIGPMGQPLPHRAGVTQPQPSSVYAATKLAQEHIIQAWAAAMKTPMTILRLQNVYGPGQSPFNPYTGIVTLFLRMARAGERIEVYEDGQIGRDFIFIDDVIHAFSSAIDNPPKQYRCLDVGSGVATTIEQAARKIAAFYHAPDPWISGKFRDGDVRWAVASTEALKCELQACPHVSFEEGTRRLGAWLEKKGLP